ncbi:3-oxoacyl-ACP reductase [Rhizobium sp. AC27/96]|uniref:SDR family NAD(P)-dependent oxidoreductase n=1 Tax=Rhizobium sp. AC27/96 TaxID=1841653 RepID=UPI0008292D0D|nr:SDR family NAD(P)-dependent oxidoreductase [Rhizobium sp. AC27/96]OCI93310.1 3-oxoacyl-ACP reductase [Rhizobium sp. AC27/96]
MDMSGKTILITGSTDGVGRRVAERLAATGATVLVHGRNAARAENLVSRIHNAGGKAAFYLAGFLLTHRLLPLLKAGSPARVVNVSSAGQQAIDFSDVMLTRGYSGVRAYCQSKLAQIMFTFDLAEELAGAGITANCLHPATYMDTTMVRLSGVTPISTVDQGADAILNLAISDDLVGRTGLYFDGLRAARASAQAYDTAARQKLRTFSQSLTDLT